MPPTASRPGLARLFLSFLGLGSVAFGGPAMVAHIRRHVVVRRGWLDEESFRQGVALCQAIPGATAMQCATYCGLRIHGTAGALAAFAGFVAPAVLLMLGLSALYAQVQGVPAALAILRGLRWVVLALVAQAAWSFARQHLKGSLDLALAALAALLFHAGAHPVLILALAAGSGAWRGRRDVSPAASPGHEVPHPGWRAWIPAAGLALAGSAVLGLAAWGDLRLGQVALTMAKIDLVAFGGGFAALPLFFREVVEGQGWMDASTFMDGITLGQVTPGPIVITATFIGHRVAGWLGALAATAGVFLPSLVMLLAAEPVFQHWNRRPAARWINRHLVLSFVGLLVSVTLRMGLELTWSPHGVLLGLAALVLLLRDTPVHWVVLGGGLVSCLLP